LPKDNWGFLGRAADRDKNGYRLNMRQRKIMESPLLIGLSKAQARATLAMLEAAIRRNIQSEASSGLPNPRKSALPKAAARKAKNSVRQFRGSGP
jgi:hypothetical protein